MDFGLQRGLHTQLEHHLLFFSGMLVLASVAYIPYSPESIVPDIPAVAVPLGVALGLVLFTIRVRPRRYESGQVEQIAGYGWGGSLVAAGIGGWWLAIHRSNGIPIGVVLDEVLTVVSVGLGAGVLFGAVLHRKQCGTRPQDHLIREHHEKRPADRDRLLQETTWTGSQSETPIFSAVVEILADLEGVDPTEIEPIYDYVNPTAFSELRAQERSQWQLHFYTETYEIRVSSLGTISVYDADLPDEPSRNVPV